MVHVIMIPTAKLWSFSINIICGFFPGLQDGWPFDLIHQSDADQHEQAEKCQEVRQTERKTKFWCIPKTDICNKDGRHFVPMEPVINFVLFIKDSPCPFIHDNPVQNPFLLYPSCLLKHGRHIPVSWLDWLWNSNYDIMKPGNVNGCRNFITWLALLIVTNIDIYTI